MKSTARIVTIAAALLAATLPLAAASNNPEIDLSRMLSGIFRGSTPGNDLTLTIRSVTTDPSHLYDLFVQVSGQYQGENIRQQGLIRWPRTRHANCRFMTRTHRKHFPNSCSRWNITTALRACLGPVKR